MKIIPRLTRADVFHSPHPHVVVAAHTDARAAHPDHVGGSGLYQHQRHTYTATAYVHVRAYTLHTHTHDTHAQPRSHAHETYLPRRAQALAVGRWRVARWRRWPAWRGGEMRGMRDACDGAWRPHKKRIRHLYSQPANLYIRLTFSTCYELARRPTNAQTTKKKSSASVGKYATR
jgi:hypothetical protein